MAQITTYRKGLKNRILCASMLEFKEKGVKAVKMDDIANKLSISKRTLYEIYSNKEELLLEGLKEEAEKWDENMRKFIKDETNNVMDVVIKFLHSRLQEVSTVNPLFYTELRKYKSIMQFLHARQEMKDNSSRSFFELGVEQGYFISQFDYSIITQISTMIMNNIMETKMYHKYELKTLFKNVIFLFLRGVCTQKGLLVLDGFMSNY